MNAPAKKTVNVDDKLGSRSRRHINLLICPEGIVNFTGQSIAPVMRVLKENYTKNGKWSHSTYAVEIDQAHELLPFRQDFETGKWFNSKTWAEAIDEFDRKLGGHPRRMGLPDVLLKGTIRKLFPNFSADMDLEEAAHQYATKEKHEMQYVNCTPHVICLNNGQRFEPSGSVARVAAGYTEFDQHGVCRATFGEVTGLPEPQKGTLYIVSGMVAAAVKGRADVVSPATGHPDAQREKGQVVSVPGFIYA